MNRLEKLKLEMAFNYPNVYEIVHMNADTPRLSGAEYLTHGFKAGFDTASAEYEKIIAELEGALKECHYFCQDQKANANEAINTICPNEECDYQCNGCIKSISDCDTTSITIIKALQKLKEFKNGD